MFWFVSDVSYVWQFTHQWCLSTENDQKQTFNVWLHDDESEVVVIQGRENQLKVANA